MPAAGTHSQAGICARVYGSQAALQMAWLSQNNLSVYLPTWASGVYFSVTSELEECIAAGVVVLCSGNCQRS